MRVRTSSFSDMKSDILSSGKRIIIFGAGMIGTVVTPDILNEYHLEHLVDLYVDNDRSKWGREVTLASGSIIIKSPDVLWELNGNEYVILLTTSRFAEALAQLQMFSNFVDTVCYIIPMLCIENFKTVSQDIIVRETETPVIPKVIHYIWLGRKELPKTLQTCIDSWKKNCPDYELKCWNEDNYDIDKIPYMQQAYSHGMYGFVPDYARIDILYHYGGIYLDTDVELIRSLDDMLYQEAFCCVEKWQTINLGGGSGSIKGNRAIGEMLAARRNLLFEEEDGRLNKNTCGYYDTKTLQKHGFHMNGKVQKILGMNIYPFEVFHPYDYMSGRSEVSVNTYGIHHFNGGWLNKEMAAANRKAAQDFEGLYKLSKREKA